MFEVSPSPIHGLGLFATAFIPAETVIGYIEGRPASADGMYVLWLTEESGVEVTNEFRYVNHASPANAAYYDDLSFVALRDIYPGQEITHDYSGDRDEEGVEAEFGDAA